VLWRNSDHVIINSYLDESFDKRPSGAYVVGGFLGRSVSTFELERRWEDLLQRPDIGIKYFKASDCNSGTGEFAKFVADPKNITQAERTRLDSISHEFLDLIAHPVPYDEQTYLCVHGVGVVQHEFYEVIKDPRALAVLGPSPYRLAYDFAMVQCAWAMKELGEGTHYGVSFTCDKDQEHSPFANETFLSMKSANPDRNRAP
jgi:hypothetical protein